MAGSSRERFGDVPSVRTGLGRRERARSLSPSSGRPAIAERTTFRPPAGAESAIALATCATARLVSTKAGELHSHSGEHNGRSA
jgi:hypothetical protein